MRKHRITNVELQKKRLRKRIEKNYKERHLLRELDNVLDSGWEDYVDSELEYDENINELKKMGILVDKITKREVEERDRSHWNDIQNSYINSITSPFYHCQVEGCGYIIPSKELMTKHFQEEHGLDDTRIPPKNPCDMTYIILDELQLITMDKEHIKKKNFTVSNQYLWGKLLKRLGYELEDKSAPSNQTPRRILDDLGLLDKHRFQKRNKIGYDKDSRRVYHLNKVQLEDAILSSEFNDLKAKLELTS